LSGGVDINLYTKCKTIYDHHRNLPENDPQYWANFEDYLKFYNISDVYPTSMAMITQFDVFNNSFQMYPLQSYGLPGYSRSIMYKNFNKTSPNFFTFPDRSDATKIFRENIIGGWTAVLKRHVTLYDEPAALAAKYNKQGESLLVKYIFSDIKFKCINNI
jgi:hypothetical protein